MRTLVTYFFDISAEVELIVVRRKQVAAANLELLRSV